MALTMRTNDAKCPSMYPELCCYIACCTVVLVLSNKLGNCILFQEVQTRTDLRKVNLNLPFTLQRSMAQPYCSSAGENPADPSRLSLLPRLI